MADGATNGFVIQTLFSPLRTERVWEYLNERIALSLLSLAKEPHTVIETIAVTQPIYVYFSSGVNHVCTYTTKPWDKVGEQVKKWPPLRAAIVWQAAKLLQTSQYAVNHIPRGTRTSRDRFVR
jgi:hypothetical protein